jgi:protease I
MSKLNNKKIAILATDGFEHDELSEPRKAIEEAGGQAIIVSSNSKSIKSWKNNEWGPSYDVDCTLENAKSDDFDGLLIPGGVINPDQLRTNSKAIEFIQGFFAPNKQKPVAAICHGPQLLIEANVVKDRKLTSFQSIKTDLKNAGAQWEDNEVVVDQGLVTSRNPDDLPAFNKKMVEEFCEGTHSS